MNILFLSTENPYPPDSGHHIRTYNVLKYLSNYNSVFFLGFARHKRELEYKKELEKFCATVDLFFVPQGKLQWRFIVSLFLNLFSPLPLTVHKYFRKEARARIGHIIKENKIDLVHIDLLHLGTYYKDVCHLPKILINHNVESLRILRWAKIEKNVLLKLYIYFQYVKLYHFEKNIISKFDKCTVVSNFDKEVLMKMNPTTSFVTIPNGVDIEYFKPDNSKIVEHSLVWVGGMDDPNNKNAVHYFLDEIFPLIQSKIPDVKLSFVGREPTSKLIKRAQANSNIKVIGYVEDVRPYIQHASVVIAPLRSGSGTKIKVLNALSLGKAVLTTSIGAEGINVVNNENIIIADDPREFAEKTVYLLENPAVAKKMGEKAREVVEKYYDWKIIGNKMHQVYYEVSQGLLS